MIKNQTWHFLAVVIGLLTIGFFCVAKTFKAPAEENHTPSRRHSQSNRKASSPPASDVPNLAEVRFDLRSVTELMPDAAAGHELRAEMHELSMALPELYGCDSSSAPDSLRFPLFDSNFVLLRNLRHQSMGANQGVLFAKADGEPDGGHVLLSYVGTALAGMIHLPSRGEFYEIRTATNGRSHILTQFHPDKIPACRGCMQHGAK